MPNPSTAPRQLSEIRASLHAAVASHDDPELRRSHAHHAADLAAEVLCGHYATAGQRRTAETYLEQAVAMRDAPTGAMTST